MAHVERNGVLIDNDAGCSLCLHPLMPMMPSPVGALIPIDRLLCKTTDWAVA